MPTAASRHLVSGHRGFRGDLAEIKLASVLTLLESERKTGTLVVETDRGRARLQLRRGRVVRARLVGMDTLRNAELLYRLIADPGGTFDFRPSKVGVGDDIQRSTSHLLLEGMRRLEQKPPAPAPPRLVGAKAAAALLWLDIVAMFLVRSAASPGSVQPAHSPGK